jgi:hypothetical protein
MAATDNASGRRHSAPVRTGSGPHPNAVAVTPSDSTDLTNVSDMLVIGAGGTLAVNMLNTGAQSFTVVAGQQLPIRVTRVWSTGTSATGIVSLWDG